MNLKIRKIKAVPGYISTTYAVYDTSDNRIIRIFFDREEAEQFVIDDDHSEPKQ